MTPRRAPRVLWDRGISVTTVAVVVQIVATVGGGFYFVGQFQEKVAAIIARMDTLERSLSDLGHMIVSDREYLNERIDRLTDFRRP